MRIAVIHNLPPGGAKRAVYEQVRALAPRHEVDVFAASKEEDGFLPLATVARRVYQCPWPNPSSGGRSWSRPVKALAPLARALVAGRALAHRVDSLGYDLALVHGCRITQAPATLRWLRTPSVYYCQEPPRKYYEDIVVSEEAGIPLPTIQRNIRKRLRPISALYRGADRAFVRKAGTLLCNSRYSAGFIHDVYRRSATTNYLGVDARRFYPTAEPVMNRVVAVGAFAPAKGHTWALATVGAVPASRRPDLVIASNTVRPAVRAELAGLARRQGVSLEIREAVSDETLRDLYSGAQATLCVALAEPFGFTALESMACQCPVLAVSEGGFQETVVHNETGWLVPRDREQLGTALHAYLQDGIERERLGQRGRAIVESQWTWERSTSQLENLLETAAARTVA